MRTDKDIDKVKDNIIITLNHIYKAIGYPSDEERKRIINCLNNKNLTNTYQTLKMIQDENSLSNQDLIREMTLYFSKTYINEQREKQREKQIEKQIEKQKQKQTSPQVIKLMQKDQDKLLNLFDNLAKIEVNLANNANENIQLLALSSIINNYNT
jgi:DNA polymerase III delta prime subunit